MPDTLVDVEFFDYAAVPITTVQAASLADAVRYWQQDRPVTHHHAVNLTVTYFGPDGGSARDATHVEMSDPITGALEYQARIVPASTPNPEPKER